MYYRPTMVIRKLTTQPGALYCCAHLLHQYGEYKHNTKMHQNTTLYLTMSVSPHTTLSQCLISTNKQASKPDDSDLTHANKNTPIIKPSQICIHTNSLFCTSVCCRVPSRLGRGGGGGGGGEGGWMWGGGGRSEGM